MTSLRGMEILWITSCFFAGEAKFFYLYGIHTDITAQWYLIQDARPIIHVREEAMD